MTGGTEFQEAAEVPKLSEEIKDSPEKIAEVKVAAEQAERTTAAVETPKAVIEEMDYKAAEALETAVVESIGPVEAPAKIESPPTITLKGAWAEGKVTIGRAAEDGGPGMEEAAEAAADGRRMTEDQEVITGSSVSLIMEEEEEVQTRTAGDSLIMEEEEEVQTRTAGDSLIMEEEEEVQTRTAGDSLIMEEEEVQTRTAGDSLIMEEEEEPVQARTVSQIMEEEDPGQSLTNPELISQLSDQLPAGSESFTDQSATDIVEMVMSGETEDFLSPTQSAIQGNFENISQNQADGLLAVSLIKAAQALETNLSGNLVQPPGADVGSDISSGLPETDPVGSNGDPGGTNKGSDFTPALPGIDPAEGSDPDPEIIHNIKGDGMGVSGDERESYIDERESEDFESTRLKLDLQDAMNKQQQAMQILSNIMKNMHDIAKAIIQNMK